MSENKDFELFGTAPTAKEGSEQSDEQFSEEMRQTQAALKQLHQEEGKAKKNDDKLAKIIVQFLSQPGNTDLFLLISRCVAQNIPSELLIAILSLIDRTAYMEMESIVNLVEHKNALTVPDHGSIHSLTGGQKQLIDEWLSNILIAASYKPQRTLESVLTRRTDRESGEVVQEICLPFIQLSAFIMRNFLAMQNTQVEYEILHDFMQSVYIKMIEELAEMLQGQKQLN